MKRTKTFTGIHLTQEELDEFNNEIKRFTDMKNVIEVTNMNTSSTGYGDNIDITVEVEYKFIDKYAQAFDNYTQFTAIN